MVTKIQAACVSILIVLGLFTGSSRASSGKGQVIELVSPATLINTFVDVGEPGPTPGDIYVFVDDLFNPESGLEKVGQAEGRCNLIDPAAGRFECTIVSSFADGTLTTDGILINAPGAVSIGSITGGTGVYRGVDGEGSVDLGLPEGPHVVRFFLDR